MKTYLPDTINRIKRLKYYKINHKEIEDYLKRKNNL